MSSIILPMGSLQQFSDFIRKHDCENWFVAKDQGAYIGATSGTADEGTFKNCIFYFKGCDPKQDEDWWDTCRHKFGGDDFGEHFDAAIITEMADDPNVIALEVSVSAEQIEVKGLGRS